MKPGDRGLLSSRAFLLAIFVLVALALKWTTFGDPNRHADETFYLLVGQRMHEGLLPYVDIWDRKPLGLFLIYYLITGVSNSVWAYQIVACLFAAATAMVICLLVSHWSDRRAGLFAGLAYLFVLGPFEGSTGQTPDFYNLFIASAALLIAREFDRLEQGQVRWPIWCAMALCGVALTIKQTVLIESLFFGCWILGMLVRARVPLPRIATVAAIACLLGALPTLLTAAFYWQVGHWREFWHAMVISNLVKAKVGGEAWRVLGILLRAALLVLFAAWGLVGGSADGRVRRYLIGWIAAAAVGFAIVPNFYGHYTLPLLVPLSVAAGLLFARHSLRLVMLVALVLYAFLWHRPLQSEWTRESVQSMAQLAAIVRQHDGGGGLLVFDGPHALYSLTGKPILSPLVFPHHLNHLIENNVSHLDTNREIERILANRPGVIVIARFPMNHPVNSQGRARVLDYARRNCRSLTKTTMSERGRKNTMVVFGDCRAP